MIFALFFSDKYVVDKVLHSIIFLTDAVWAWWLQQFNTNSKGGQMKPESVCKINYCQVLELSVHEL